LWLAEDNAFLCPEAGSINVVTPDKKQTLPAEREKSNIGKWGNDPDAKVEDCISSSKKAGIKDPTAYNPKADPNNIWEVGALFGSTEAVGRSSGAQLIMSVGQPLPFTLDVASKRRLGWGAVTDAAYIRTLQHCMNSHSNTSGSLMGSHSFKR
jgi:hypothetical protein